eukprot:Cvel_24942.t2-p1 / transcript=Cvel_24942.t2 / gene=Cvel_24942 / organism=Chromera_velia_CCMP2878 / gene_product=Protein MAATS1, putative / transcript_product=Protein MAATS1, putative / location=Cvel_scaffold2760:2463-3451(+) / protein_length=329 / sequence_SO=supercontig / SO=protein_coding / is_pseudo=false
MDDAGGIASASVVKSRKAMTATRPFDHLYDPVMSLPHPVDHARQTFKSLAGRWEKVPTDALFSELPHHPRQMFRVQQNKDLPLHVDRNWNPNTQHDHDVFNVSSKYLPKYLKRPLVAQLSFNPKVMVVPMPTLMRGPAGAAASLQKEPYRPIVEPRIKNQYAQTVFRESEAQTDPYTPDYVVLDGTTPEVLTIATLAYNEGLPATTAEVNVIEKMRQKRKLDSMLPPTTDEFSFKLREKIITEQEFRAWALRESTIRRLQERRLELVKQALAAREEQREARSDAKVERVRVRKMEERDKLLAATQRKRLKILRKILLRKKLEEAAIAGP